MVEKMSGSIGGNNRAADAIKKRQLAIKGWPDTETGKQPAVRRPEQFTINFEKGTVFLSAVASGDIDEVRNLLDEGVDIDFSNVDGLTALHQACIDENDEMVQLLIDRGADIEARDNEGWTPLHAAASAGNVDIAQILIKHDADLKAVNNEGEVPLDLVEDDDMEEYLDEVTEKQDLDLDEARAEEEDLMLENAKKWAMNNRIDNEKLDWQGATSLHVAAAKNYEDVLKKLLQIKSVNVNIPDVDGWTPLHAAMHWSNKEACEILAKAGADFNIRNSNGHTPCEVADPDFVKFAEGLRKQYSTKNDISNKRDEQVNEDFLKLVKKLLSKEPPRPAVKGGRESVSKTARVTPAISSSSRVNRDKPADRNSTEIRNKDKPTDRNSMEIRNKDTNSTTNATPVSTKSSYSSTYKSTRPYDTVSISARLGSTSDGGKTSSLSNAASSESSSASSAASDSPAPLGTYRSLRNTSRITNNHTPDRGGDDDDDSNSSTSRTSYTSSRTTDKYKSTDLTSSSRTSSWSSRNPTSSTRDTSSTTRTSLYSSGTTKSTTPSTDTGGSTTELQQKLDKALQEVEEYKQKYEKMKKEKEDLERKLDQYKDDIDKMQELKSDNLRLKDENGALIRVISKLSRTPSSS